MYLVDHGRPMLRIVQLLLLLVGVACRPIGRPSDALVQDYLLKYGYMRDSNELSSAIRLFQKDLGFEETDELTKEQLELMQRPRCGTLARTPLSGRQKRFVPYRRKWSRPTLTWRLIDPDGYLRPYDKYVIRNNLHRAFTKWSSGSKGAVNFVEVDEGQQTDITALFAKGDHNDTLPFDGQNGVVAHGFYPTDGSLHFDADERWTLNMNEGVNLFQTATHEIGHLLGLEHSSDFRAVMYPINRPFDPDYRLANDDVRGIRYLYSPWPWRFFWNRYWRATGAKASAAALALGRQSPPSAVNARPNRSDLGIVVVVIVIIVVVAVLAAVITRTNIIVLAVKPSRGLSDMFTTLPAFRFDAPSLSVSDEPLLSTTIANDGTGRRRSQSFHVELLASPAVLDKKESIISQCDDKKRRRSSVELHSAVNQLSRLVATISTPHVSRHEMTQDDIFLQRFSTRNVALTSPTRAYGGRKRSLSVRALHTGRWCCSLSETVLAPDGSVLFYWLFIVSMAVQYCFWSLAPRIAYDDMDENHRLTWLCFDLLVDVIFALDIFVQYRTGYLEQGIVIADLRLLARRYFRSTLFCVDLVSIVPADHIWALWSGSHPTRVALRLVRLIKTYRVWRFRSMIESRTTWPNAIRVLSLTHLLILTCHWFACVHYILAKSSNFANNKWFSHMDDTNILNATVTRRYLLSLYWATLTLTTIGNQASPRTNVEYLFTIASYLMGVFYFATIVGQVGNVITNRNASRLEYERLFDGSKQYMRYHKVPKMMQKRVQRWYDYSWSRGRMTGGSDIQSLAVLPDKLKTELALHVNLDTLKKVSMFKDCQPEFLHDLVLKMRAVIFTPGDIICRRGEIAREMYIIADGLLQVLDGQGTCIREMRSGDFFGEIGVLNLHSGANRRTADVQSVGYSELFTLSRDDVLSALRDYPEAEKIISDYGRRRLLNSSPRLTTPEREREAGAQLRANQLNHVNAASSLLMASSQHSTRTSFRRPSPAGKRASDSDPLLTAAREQLSRPSRESSIEKVPRQSVPNYTTECSYRMSRHMSIGPRERVAVPSPVTNLLGCRIDDSPTPSTIRSTRLITSKSIDVPEVSTSSTVTHQLGSPKSINEHQRRFLKRCDAELCQVTERLETLVAPQLKFHMNEEVGLIRTFLEQVKAHAISQNDVVQLQMKEIAQLREQVNYLNTIVSADRNSVKSTEESDPDEITV
uniref:Cyclic nucleotide-binding domain-containing protein n=2 Tax=Plectus sambesii TaxID=2011161 RepID=A0A914WJW7_9BILA